jgi:uncharacterized protein with HEPN domain
VRDDTARPQDILEACELLVREIGPRVREIRTDPIVQAATQRWIETIGEAASRLSSEITSANPDIPWRSMIGMRNVLAHGYFDIDPAVVEAVLERDIPRIAGRIKEILAER